MTTTLKTLFLGISLFGFASCSTKEPIQKPLVLTPNQAKFACSAHEWHEEWTEPNACVTCSQEVQTCMRGKGFDFCKEDCDSCLGQEACARPSNVDYAVAANEASKHKPGQIRALIRADVSHSSVLQVQINSNGLVLIGDQIFNKNGPLWTIYAAQECRRPQLNDGVIYALCGDHIKVFVAATGFRLADLKIFHQIDSNTEADVDPFGKTYQLKSSNSVRIFDKDGKQIAIYESADAVTRVGPTWNDHAVLQAGNITYFQGGKKTESKPSRFEETDRIAVDGAFISQWNGDKTTAFDTISRTWFSSPGPLEFHGRSALQTEAKNGVIQEVFPTQRNWEITGKTPSDANRYMGWLSNSEIGMYRVINDELFATVFAPGGMAGSFDSVLPAVQLSGGEFRSTASRHGGVVWSAAVENEDAVWIASPDGLVKRWSFETGEGVRADIPFEFAIGGGHATSDQGLVLMSRAWNPVESQYSPGHRVMIWHPTQPAKILNFPKTVILDAALADKNTLIVVGKDSTFWWDLTADKAVHTEAGLGHMSKNGKSIAFFKLSSIFNRVTGPARFFRTDLSGKRTRLDSVQSCAFSPNGDKITCTIPKKNPYEFSRRVYSVEDGELLDEIAINGNWIVFHLSPAGDAELDGNLTHHSMWTVSRNLVLWGEDDFSLGFSYGGRLMMVDGDYLKLEDY